MRKRGYIALFAAVPGWIYWAHSYNAARNGPFAYEFGSAVWPIPSRMRVVGSIAFLFTLMGLCLLAFDFSRRARKKDHDDVN